MRPPTPVTASRRPSGLKSTDRAAPSSARRTRRRRRVAVSIRSTAPSLCVTASVRPSGLTAIPLGANDVLESPADGEAPVEATIAREIPEDRARVQRAGDQRASVAREVEPVDRTAVSGEALSDGAPLDVPREHLPVPARGHERPSVGREAHPEDAAVVPAPERADPRRSRDRAAGHRRARSPGRRPARRG